MQTSSEILTLLKIALAELTDNCYHYVSAPNTTPPYIVWTEDGDNDLLASNLHAERCITGTIDLYTLQEDDSLQSQIEETLESLGVSWFFNSFQFETETGLLHFEWVFGVT